ncbi:hypothetical protein [Mycolicibacterium sp.]|uniref:hypothetical protein n=1 Tax=Mycolicibacterium sp. TaxID=2320850 RepID=UPI0028B1E8E7|nr:hypothetical protein [Mycolicibacterium sp.]
MSSVQLHPWGLSYLAVALLFGIATIVVADHLRSVEAPSATVQGTAAVVAGALWPVMVVGLAQLLILRTVMNWQRPQLARHAAEVASSSMGRPAGAH